MDILPVHCCLNAWYLWRQEDGRFPKTVVTYELQCRCWDLNLERSGSPISNSWIHSGFVMTSACATYAWHTQHFCFYREKFHKAGCAHAAGVIPTAPDSRGSRAVMLTMPLRWQPGEMLRALDVFPRGERKPTWLDTFKRCFFLVRRFWCVLWWLQRGDINGGHIMTNIAGDRWGALFIY